MALSCGLKPLEGPEGIVDYPFTGGRIDPAWAIFCGSEFREERSKALAGSSWELLEGVRSEQELFVRFVESWFFKCKGEVVPKDKGSLGCYLRYGEFTQNRAKLLKGFTGIPEAVIRG